MNRLPIYILAGGQSRRFGSDKARAILNGKPLIVRVPEMLQPVSEDATVVADVPDKFADLGLRTIADDVPGLGPLGGLNAAFNDRVARHGAGWLLLAACDVTVIKTDWVMQLLDCAQGPSTAVAFRGEMWQPMLAAYHTDLQPILQTSLDRGRRSMQQLLDDAPGSVALPVPDDMPVDWQINTPEALARLQSPDPVE